MRRVRLRILLAGAFTLLIIGYHIELSSYTERTGSTEGEAVTVFYETPVPSSIDAGVNEKATPEAIATKTPSVTASEVTEEAVPWPELPEGFVYLAHALPEAKFDVRYATSHNFTGQVVQGYHSNHICATVEATEALNKASSLLAEKGCGLLIYDAYRPKQAVDFFICWGETPEDHLTKAEFYPDFDKKDLFKKGYLAKRSAHSRGSTVDLTLFDLGNGRLLDMGSPYDFLGPISNHGTTLITEAQTKNRNRLKEAMKASGFKELKTEWWHYQLIDEPFPETYFDFTVE